MKKDAGTESERLFDKYCCAEDITCSEIPKALGEQGKKTADRRLDIDGRVIIVEVKGLDHDSRGIDYDSKGRVFGRSLSPSTVEIGAKVRHEIKAANRQIKSSRSDVDGPSYGLAVLYADDDMSHHLQEFCVAEAMYGDGVMELTLINGIRDRSRDRFKRGGRRRMTPSSDTSTSAVAVLSKRWPHPAERERAPDCGYFLHLDVYHNAYAQNPLPPSLLANGNTRHFRYNFETHYWEAIEEQ
ncbi:MAG: hypothetical protein OXP36_00600 [Gammaproteobacteria bacterium]|nr:hypothetical protein [Gammaproteobacteria bacterium]